MQNALKQLNERIHKAFWASMTVTENGSPVLILHLHSHRLELIYLVITIDSIGSYTNRNVYSAADIQAHSVYSADNHNLSMQMTRGHICARHIMAGSCYRFSQVLRLLYVIHCMVWQHTQRNISQVMCIRGCVGLLFFKDCSQLFKQSCPPEYNPKPVPVTINT